MDLVPIADGPPPIRVDRYGYQVISDAEHVVVFQSSRRNREWFLCSKITREWKQLPEPVGDWEVVTDDNPEGMVMDDHTALEVRELLHVQVLLKDGVYYLRSRAQSKPPYATVTEEMSRYPLCH